MYTVAQLRNWSVPHLKAGCWYIDCGKTFCPEDKEEVKKSSVKAEPRGVESKSNDGNDHDGHEDEEVDDVSLLPKKKKNKILKKKKKRKIYRVEKIEKEAFKKKSNKQKAKKVEEKAASKARYIYLQMNPPPLQL
jgi:hypothetical protein